jgi:hypothetical protein
LAGETEVLGENLQNNRKHVSFGIKYLSVNKGGLLGIFLEVK